MADVVVFGTVAADVVLRMPIVPQPGDHTHAEHLGWRLGGSSANVACGLAAAGHRVELVGPVGNDAVAAQLVGELERRGVGTERLVEVPAPAPRALLLLNAAGERAIIGLDSGFSHLAFPFRHVVAPGSADCVYVESYERYPVEVTDMSADPLLVATPPVAGVPHWPADVLVGSEAQYPAGSLAQPYASARLAAGPRLRWVVVTRGPAGATAYGADGECHVPSRRATPVDTTGAGDAFTAALLAGLLDGLDIRGALELGVAHGAAAVELLQSVPPNWIDGAGPS